MIRYLSVLIAIGCATGCYYYEPIDTPQPAPGSYLSATLNDLGTDTLSRTIGPDVRSIRGRLLTSDGTALRLSVTGVTSHHGENITWKGESVTLNRIYLAGLEQRRLSKGRTAIIVGATVVGLVTTYKIFQGVGLIPTNSGGPPPPK
jgi:hypothetical protein